MASGSDQPGELSKLEQPRELICPICFEAYKTPRSLSCLHTFCEGCITSFVLEAVGKGSMTSVIQCPVCSKDTEPLDPSKPPAEWARELPLNSAIVPLLGVRESESAKQCGICAKKNEQRCAKSFCIECNDFQCDRCIETHKHFPFMENHRMLELEEADISQQLNLGNVELCKQHPTEKLKVFCKDHAVCCCSICASVKHRDCKTVTEIKELGQSLREGNKPELLNGQMTKIQKELKDCIRLLEKNICDIVQEADDIPRRVKELRSKIIQNLDHLVENVTSQCGQLKNQQKTEIEDKITSIRSQEAALIASRSLLEIFTKQGTETQLFLSYCKLQDQVQSCQLEDVRRSVTTTEIRLTVHECLTRLMKFTGTTFADVSVHVKQRHVPMAECVMKVSSIFDIQKRQQMQQPGYGGAQHLPDGRLVAIDYYNHMCCILGGEYNVTAEVKFPSSPVGMTLMGQSEVVAVLPYSNQLHRVSVGTGLTLNGTIPCTRKPRCVSRFSDTELVVGWDQGLSIIDMDGTEKTYMAKDSSGRGIEFCMNSRILADTVTSRLYQSSFPGNAVYGIGMTGKALFTYTNNQLRGPAGLALDRDRNLYVCSHGTKSVHQISPDGQAIRIIDVGFDCPYTVFFDLHAKQMRVVQCFPTNYLVNVSFESV